MRCTRRRSNAAWLVKTKQADYLLQVKANQPSVLEACRNIPDAQFSEAYEHTERGHGRIETREVRAAPVPEGLDFPYAKQVIVVYRTTFRPGRQDDLLGDLLLPDLHRHPRR